MVDVRLRHLARRRPVRTEWNRRWADRLPRVLIGLEALASLPRPLRGRLAPRVRDLDAEFRGADALAVRDHARKRRLAVVRVDSDAAMRDAPAPLHIGHLDEHEPGA